MTCEMFLCPSHAWLTEEEAALVRGLHQPPTGTSTAWSSPTSTSCGPRSGRWRRSPGRRVEARHLAHQPFREALARLLALKQELAPGSDGLFGAFKPGRDGGEVPRTIDYEALARERLALRHHPDLRRRRSAQRQRPRRAGGRGAAAPGGLRAGLPPPRAGLTGGRGGEGGRGAPCDPRSSFCWGRAPALATQQRPWAWRKRGPLRTSSASEGPLAAVEGAVDPGQRGGGPAAQRLAAAPAGARAPPRRWSRR